MYIYIFPNSKSLVSASITTFSGMSISSISKLSCIPGILIPRTTEFEPLSIIFPLDIVTFENFSLSKIVPQATI